MVPGEGSPGTLVLTRTPSSRPLARWHSECGTGRRRGEVNMVTWDEVRQARDRIREQVVRTPLVSP
ncbi:MAG: hypothetical protein AB1816_04020, partial [Bacillota bacterium]